jgi:hypothetical protein
MMIYSIIGVLTLAGLIVFGQTWMFMLLFGAVHSFIPAVPAFGFWQVFILIALLDMIIKMFRTASIKIAS